MAIVDVTARLGAVSFAPANEYEEILQNVRTILTTTKYSVPLDRGFGIDANLIDTPIDYAQAKLTAEIIDAIRRYEPRVSVSKVSFAGNGVDGKLIPTVRVVINDD